MESTGNRFKKIVYDYDLISGKVNEVSYQPGMKDAFYHQYYYDAENRLTEVKTSRDKIFWERDAAYEYYRHGPLARTILGQQQVQGVDYAYTLQGWLKGVNSTVVSDGNWDMGNDGKTTGSIIARDAYGFSLNYFNNNYDSIGSTNPFAETTIANELYNGNISAMMVNLPKIGAPLLFTYRYDQLNRIVNQYAFNGLDSATNNWNAQALLDYGESVTYDPNGNILAYKRNGDASRSNASFTGMDNLTYTYTPNKNRLSSVQDDAPDALANEYGRYNDIRKDKTYNYQYDAIGNMVSNTGEGISNIEWNVYGKIKSITKTGVNISYTYDASGNRISKTVNGKATYYVRDASGNVMSVYEMKDTLKQKEINLFGSSRLGIYKVDVDVQTCNTVSPEVFTFTRGNKLFELTNHLGNVLSIISDKRMQQSSNGTTVDYYSADIRSAQNYYPFGMMMPGIPGNPGSPAETAAVPDSLLEADNYDSGIGGWEVYNPCTIVNDNGRVKVSTDQVWGTPGKELLLKKGRYYRLRFTLDIGNCGQLNLPVYDPQTMNYVVMPETGLSLTKSGVYEGTFRAFADKMGLLFEVVPGGGNPTPDSTAYFWVDDFSLEEIHPQYELVSRNRWTIVKPDSGKIKVLATSAWGEAHKILKVTTGKQYRLRYDLDLGNCHHLHVIVSNPADGSYVYPAETGLSIYNSGEEMGTFTAAADSLELRFQMPEMPVGADTGYFWVNDVWVDEIIPYEGGGGVSGSEGGYRYGFNGQEKSTEINGSENLYTAQFWEYDSRIGRRWNIDPVKKPWQSDYACFSNSPIWKLDPDGDDDFFNSEGKLIKQTNTGSKIYVQTAIGNVAYSQLPMNNMHNRQTLANITAYYAGQVGISGTVGVSNYPKNRNSKALAFTKGNEIYVNARAGGVGVTPLFDDYNNLKSALRHEKDHKDKGQGFSETSNFEHAEVYLTQIKDPTFSKTTADFKKGMAGSIASYLKNAAYDEMRNGNGDFRALTNLVADFNKQSKTTGYTFSLVQTQSGYSNPEGYQYEVYASPVKSEKKK